MSEPLGHEPEETHDREFAPVLREDEESLSREQARTQDRKVTGTGVATPVPAEPEEPDNAEPDPTEARSRLEDPSAGEADDGKGDDAESGRRGGGGPG